MVQRLKHLPAMRETRVWSLGWEDSLEKEMAAHSSILAWRIPWTEEPRGLQSTGSQRVGYDWATSLSHSFFFTFNSGLGIMCQLGSISQGLRKLPVHDHLSSFLYEEPKMFSAHWPIGWGQSFTVEALPNQLEAARITQIREANGVVLV